MSSHVDKLGREKKDPRKLWKELHRKYDGDPAKMLNAYEEIQRLEALKEAIAR